MGTLSGNMEGAPLPGTLREGWIFRGWDVEGSVAGCFLRGAVGEPEEGYLFTGNCKREREWKEGYGNRAYPNRFCVPGTI